MVTDSLVATTQVNRKSMTFASVNNKELLRFIKLLSHKYEDLSLIPIIHGKSQLGWHVCISPAMVKQTQEDPWGLLISKSSLTGEVQVPMRDPVPVSRKMVDF